MSTRLPSEISLVTILTDNGSKMSRWITLFKGRAPRFGSNPSRAKNSLAFSEILTLISFALNLFSTFDNSNGRHFVDKIRANIRRHHNNGVFKRNHFTFGISQPAVFKNLQ